MPSGGSGEVRRFTAQQPLTCEPVGLQRYLLHLLPHLTGSNVSVDLESVTDTARFVFVISVEQGHEATWAIVDDVLHAFGLASTARGVAASSDGPLILTKHVEGEAQDILRELTVSVDRRSLIFGTKTGRIFTADISEANDALTFEEPFRYANESKLAVRALLEVPTGIGPLLLIGREGGFIDFVGPSTDNTVINAMTVEAELSSGDNENYNRGHQITLIAMVEPDLVAIASTRARTFLFRPSQIQDPRTVADLIREAHAAAPPLAPGSPRDLRSVFRCESSDGKRTVICVSRGGVVQPAWIDASCVLRLHDGDRGGMDLGVGYISQLDLLCRGNVPRGENPLRITLTTENGLLLGRVGDGVTWEEFPIDSLAVGSLCREADRWMALSSIDGQTSIFLVDQNPAPTVRRNIGALMVGLRERAPLLALEWIPAPWGERDSPILRMVSMAGDNSVTVREFRVHNEQADVAPDASLLALSDEIEEAACSLDVHRFENVLRRLDERDVVARFENAAHADEGSDPSMLRAIGVRQLACVLAGAIIVFPEEDRTNLLRIALDFLARLRAYAAAAPVRFEVRRELVGRINQAIRLARKRVLFANEASIGPFRSWSAYLKKDNWRTEEMLEVAYYASRRFMTECPPGFSVSAHIHDRRGGVLDDAKSWSGRSWPSRPGKFAVETHQDGGNSTHNFPIRELLRTGEEVTESATTRFYEDPTDFLGVIYGTSHGRVRWFPPSPLVRGSEPSDLTEEETAESVGIAIGDLGSAIRWIYLYPVEQRKDAIIVVAASDHGQIGCWWATYETRRRLHTQALWYSFEENGIVGLDRGRVQGQDCLVIVNRIGDIVLFDQGCLDDSPLSLPGRRVDRLRTGFRPDAMALVPSSVDDDGSAVELKLEGDVRVRVQPLLCRGSAERMEKLPKIAAKLLQSLAARVPSRLRETVAEVGRVASTRALLVKLCFWLADVDAEDKSTLAPVDRSRVQISDVPYALQGVLRAARELAALSDRSDPTAVNARLRSAGELFFRLGDREALESLLESALISLNERLVLQGQLAAANSVFDSLMQMCNDLHVGRSRRLTLRFIKTVIDGHSLLELLKATSSDDSLRRERAQDLLGKRARLINSALLDPDSVLTLEATRAATGALFECALRLDKEGLIIDDVDVFDGFLDTAFRLSSGIQENRGHRGILRRELARAFALTTRICRRRIMACGIKCDLRDFDIDFRLAIADEMSTLRLIGLGLEEDEIRLFRASAGIRQEDDDKPYLLKPEMIADLGGDTWPEPERTGLLSWRLVDSTLDWLQGLERVLYDEPRRLGLQISSVGALAGNFTEFIARESAIGDPFRRTNRFLERALKDFDRRIREWQDGAELRQDELPRILRFVVEEIVTWARQWRNRLSEESRTRRGSGIRSPITERISDGFLRIEKAAEWCPRGAAVQREVLLTYLNHGAVESVHESSLALYELGAFIARHSEDYEPQMRERLFDRKERHKALKRTRWFDARSGSRCGHENDRCE